MYVEPYSVNERNHGFSLTEIIAETETFSKKLRLSKLQKSF